MTVLKVTKHNELITSRVNFTLMEYRIFLYGVSLIDTPNDAFPLRYAINVKSFAKMFNIDADRMYHVLKETLADRMFNRSMTVEKEGTKKRRYHLVRYIDYDDHNGTLEIQFDEEIKPFVHQLKSHFTSYYLEQVTHFKSTYSIRFYEWCTMWLKQNNGKPTQFFLQIQEIKERLEIENKYQRYNNLKARVIQNSFDEINAFSDISVRYEEIKKGRSIYQLKITVKYKKWEKKEEQFTFPFDPNLKLNE